MKPFTEHEISFLNFWSAIERDFRSLVIFLVLFELRRSAPQETGDYLGLTQGGGGGGVKKKKNPLFLWGEAGPIKKKKKK